MKIAVIGAGAIGGLVGGYLSLKGEEVVLVGHPDSVKMIQAEGVHISGVRGDFDLKVDAAQRLKFPVDLAVFSTKTQDLAQAVVDNLEFLRTAKVITTQNGLQADYIVSRYLPESQIISSIVMYGATLLEPAKIVHNFEGSWVLGKVLGGSTSSIAPFIPLLEKAFPIVVSEEIKGMKYLKVFVNANNCIPALLGVSMQEAFSDQRVSKISIAIWKEGLALIQKAGITLVSLPDFPLERLMKLTSLPVEGATKIYTTIMMNLSKTPLYGSVLQSIKRGKVSEIDYINGEFVRLAKAHNAEAALNEKLVAMVHRLEKDKKFLSKEELIAATAAMVN